jgi:hypothetical protein
MNSRKSLKPSVSKSKTNSNTNKSKSKHLSSSPESESDSVPVTRRDALAPSRSRMKERREESFKNPANTFAQKEKQRKRKFRPGQVALKEIKKLQMST